MMMNYDAPRHVKIYIDEVKENPKLYCVRQHKLISLIEHIFTNENLIWDEEQIEKYFSYEKYFPFSLFDWERFVFVLHNCVFREDGFPRWKTLFLYVGRGAGKNGYLSFEDFCLLTETNGILEYDIDLCATNEDQAYRTFKDIYNVLENPKFKKKFKNNFKWSKEEITNLKTRSTLKARTNNAKGKDGLRSGKVDFDEVHAYENEENLNVFMTGLGKKAHPRLTYATTDGYVREGPLDDMKSEGDRILDREIEDHGTLPFMCCIDFENDVHDEIKWNHANPSLKYLPNLLEEMKDEYIKYKRKPNENSSFLVKRMNYPKIKIEREATSWENIKKTNRELPEYEGKKAVIGIDYTKINDMASCGFLYRNGDDICYVQKTWFCSNSADKTRIKAPLNEWSTMKIKGINILEIVDDTEISPYLITDFILEMGKYFEVEVICLDNFRLALIARALKEIGYEYTRSKDSNVKCVRPTDIAKTVPVIDSLFDGGKVVVGDNPLFRWAVRNTKKKPVQRGNEEYDKIEPKSRKNDTFMSFVQACTELERLDEGDPVSIDDYFVFTC